MNKKNLEKLKEFFRGLVVNWAKNIKKAGEGMTSLAGVFEEQAELLYLSVHQAGRVLGEVMVVQAKAIEELRGQHPKLFWFVPILNVLVVVSIVTSQLFPGIFSQILFIFGVVVAGLLTLSAPVILVYVIRHEETRTPFVFLLAFVAAVIAPVAFFGGLYIWLGLPSSGEAFYFSITTFVTVGFGDEPLINAGLKVAAALEGFIGYLYLGVLIAAIPRVIDSTPEVDKPEKSSKAIK